MFWALKLSLKSKICIGLVSSYSLYTLTMMYKTNLKIKERESMEDPVKRFDILKVFGIYQNPFHEYEHETIFHFIINQIRKLFHFENFYTIKKSSFRDEIPVYQPNQQLIHNHWLYDEKFQSQLLPPKDKRMLFTWLGQSTAFLQISNLNILTDPVFEDYIINRFGPKRVTPLPCQLEDLPNPDLIMVSHDHPDHLEESSIERLRESVNSLWIVPTGVLKELKAHGIKDERILEMSWWEKKDITERIKILNCGNQRQPNDKWEVACVPAMHWSGKKLYDSNTTLWGSFILFKNDKPVFYHVGDSGFQKELFEGIRSKYLKNGDKISLIMAPIGQYSPEWNKCRHTSPDEIIDLSNILNNSKTIGVHYGTFLLSSEPILEPKQITLQRGNKNVTPADFGKTEIFSIDN